MLDIVAVMALCSAHKAATCVTAHHDDDGTVTQLDRHPSQHKKSKEESRPGRSTSRVLEKGAQATRMPRAGEVVGEEGCTHTLLMQFVKGTYSQNACNERWQATRSSALLLLLLRQRLAEPLLLLLPFSLLLGVWLQRGGQEEVAQRAAPLPALLLPAAAQPGGRLQTTGEATTQRWLVPRRSHAYRPAKQPLAHTHQHCQSSLAAAPPIKDCLEPAPATSPCEGPRLACALRCAAPRCAAAISAQNSREVDGPAALLLHVERLGRQHVLLPHQGRRGLGIAPALPLCSFGERAG